MVDNERTRYISLIHAQKASAGIPDDVYRGILEAATGQTSCSALGVPALQKIFGIFNGILESQKQQKYVFPAPKRACGTMEDAVRARAAAVLGAHAAERMAGFLKKIGRPSLDKCSRSDLARVMGFLFRVERQNNGAR